MRIGIVGSGGIAQRHLGVLSGLPGLEVVGHVSASEERAEAQAARWGGAAFANVDDLLTGAQLDAVWICVTPDRHGALEFSLIDHQVPFFIEKPLSADLATAETIAGHLGQGGPIVAVGYKFRALDTLPRVRELLRERPPRMVLAAWHDSLPPPAWWRHAAQSGGQVVEQATHLLDLARVLVGEATVDGSLAGRWPRVDAPDSDVPDVSVALLRFTTSDGPVPGSLTATCLLAGHGAVHLQLICEGRVLTLSERALIVQAGQDTQEIPTTVDPFLIENLAFIDAISTGDPARVLCTYADALETHRLACAIRDATSET